MFQVDTPLSHQSVVSLNNVTVRVPNTNRTLISNFTFHFKQVRKMMAAVVFVVIVVVVVVVVVDGAISWDSQFSLTSHCCNKGMLTISNMEHF